MSTIKPITELRNTNEISEFCHEREQALLEVYRKLGEAETGLLNGVKPLDGEVVFSRLRAKYGYGEL